jgi:hypothetical protein
VLAFCHGDGGGGEDEDWARQLALFVDVLQASKVRQWVDRRLSSFSCVSKVPGEHLVQLVARHKT